jgi:hypothetical protein
MFESVEIKKNVGDYGVSGGFMNSYLKDHEILKGD